MLTAERRAAILKLIHKQGSVYVPDLSQRFNVSPSTIRRDLEWLVTQKDIQRTYGGAIATDAPPGGVQPDGSPTNDVAERIGQAAADLVAPGEAIFIGPGSLCQTTAQHLCHRSQITILTNALGVAWILYQNSTLPVIVTGGPMVRPDGALVGQLAHQALETLRADRLIIEASGVSPIEGLTCEQLPQAEVIRPLLESVSQVVVLTTAERLGRAGAAWLGPVSEADVIITSREAPAAIVWDLSETGVKVTLV